MKMVLKGHLRLAITPLIMGEFALPRLLAEAKESGKETNGPLSVLIAGCAISATGHYDPVADVLTVDGPLR